MEYRGFTAKVKEIIALAAISDTFGEHSTRRGRTNGTALSSPIRGQEIHGLAHGVHSLNRNRSVYPAT
jgi:hypothetical protein